MNPTVIETIPLNVPCPKCHIVAGGPKNFERLSAMCFLFIPLALRTKRRFTVVCLTSLIQYLRGRDIIDEYGITGASDGSKLFEPGIILCPGRLLFVNAFLVEKG